MSGSSRFKIYSKVDQRNVVKKKDAFLVMAGDLPSCKYIVQIKAETAVLLEVCIRILVILTFISDLGVFMTDTLVDAKMIVGGVLHKYIR